MHVIHVIPLPAVCIHMSINYVYMYVGKVDDTVETTSEHKRTNSEKVLPEENSLGNG